jgi:hypothetical protein
LRSGWRKCLRVQVRTSEKFKQLHVANTQFQFKVHALELVTVLQGKTDVTTPILLGVVVARFVLWCGVNTDNG